MSEPMSEPSGRTDEPTGGANGRTDAAPGGPAGPTGGPGRTQTPPDGPLGTGPSRTPPLVRGRRHAFAILAATGAAIVGLVLLVVLWVSVGVRTLEASAAGGQPCLEAYDADEGDAEVSYHALPPQSVCSWEVDGVRQEVVVTSAPTALAATGAVLAGGGIVGAAALLVVPRLRDRR